MQYIGNVIRPPSEAGSIILQVTVGCSHNKCTFCGAYKDIAFSIKSQQTIVEDLEFAGQHCRRQKRLFLADGDVLILSQARLVALLTLIRKYLPWVLHISLYGNAKAIRNKSVTELLELKKLGLNRIYMGLESGNDSVLRSIRKDETAKSMIGAAQKVNECGIFLSVSILLGIGGLSDSKRHAVDTANTLNNMAPRQIGALTFMPLPNTPLGRDVKNGNFTLLTQQEILEELSILVSHLNLKRCQFHANHASNYLPLAGRLPRDKYTIISAIAMAQQGVIPTLPEHKRAL